jgi:hypothetical protein
LIFFAIKPKCDNIEHCKKSMKGGTTGTYVSGAWGKWWEEMMEGERMRRGGGWNSKL